LPPATRCQILRLKCIKFDFGWGSAPDPAGGAYSAPPDLLAGFEGPTSKGGEERGGEGKKEKIGEAFLVMWHVADEAFRLKSAPALTTNQSLWLCLN